MPKANKSILKVLARNIRTRRVALGLTQEEVAERMRVVPRHYQKFESGESNITMTTLARIAKALGSPANQLLVEVTKGE